MRLCATAAVAIMFVLAVGGLVTAGDHTAAHDIAEKFAREAAKDDPGSRRRVENEKRLADEQSRKSNTEWRKLEETEMLARARAEAEQRRAEMLRAREDAERADRQRKADEEAQQAETARKIEEERHLAATRRQAEEEARAHEARQAEAASAAEEERRLADVRKAEEEARAEAVRKAADEYRHAEARRKAGEDARIAEELRQVESARRAETARLEAEARRRAEDERLAEIRQADEMARLEAARRAAEEESNVALQTERETEALRLAERLRSVREEREARAAAHRAARDTGNSEPTGSAGAATYQASGGEADRDAGHAVQREHRMAVLLLMQPGDRGIRRNNKTADPVLCSYHDCYVSNGPDDAASLLPARKALGFFRTWGQRAGACNNSLWCVFRDVELENMDGMLMPVDMRVVRHDRREPQDVVAASDCRLERAGLTCRNGIYADDYVMWVVPESLATRAGPAVLLQALRDGLPSSERTASAPPWSTR